MPTVSSFTRYNAREVSRFHAWFAIRFCDTMPRQSVTHASYPNVRTRAVVSMDGRRVWGQGLVSSRAVHVLIQLLIGPWTKMILNKKH